MSATEGSSTTEKKVVKKDGKTFVERKQLPSVKYLLVHGDPETAHLPKTWCEIIGYPLALAIVFAISLLIFHHAPHHLMPPRKKYSIPGMQRLPMFQKDGKPIPPPLHRHPLHKLKEANDKQKLDKEAEQKSEL
ncbi:hypothetical protein IV203_033772 [Nitzschia inconspicua]|uniref:Uncharacterized protein n=1 Tax=Nitzschia inconspicua TaxID=303405 RepID=A0A9K3Q6R1_9STRA|nr:hypothetical protein IV203_033772 [Nitzschia inconspicua]